jgi:polar amino acid transport system permease protein
MLFEANSIGATTFDYMEPITVVGVLFIVISYPTSVLLRVLERRLVR